MSYVYSLKKQLSTKSLKSGSVWTLASFASENIVRMTSSLVLTRIFLPEVFGLLAILFALNAAMEMISSIGIRYSVINQVNGTKRYFLETAWTLQILRGIILWLLLTVLSPFLANLFDEPRLVEYIPVSALVLLIQGFYSIGLFTYARNLGVAKVVIVKLIVQVISLVFVVVFSIITASIWVIIIGAIISSILTLILSHFYFRAEVYRFRLNKIACSQIVKVGKWIMVATIFHFFIGQGDRLIIGLFVTKTELGLYNLASMFTQIPLSIVVALTANILMPFLSTANREPSHNFNAEFENILKKLVFCTLPLALLLVLIGPLLISLLYSQEYSIAGELLQILALGMLFQLSAAAIMPLFLAKGDPKYHMLSYFFLFVLLLIAITTANMFGSINFVALCITVAKVIWLSIIVLLARKHSNLNLTWLYALLLLTSFLSILILVHDDTFNRLF